MSDFGQLAARAECAEAEREEEIYFGGTGGIMSGKRFSEYNELLKENEKLYRNAVKNVGLSDCTFWILYFLRDCGADMTQSDICSAMFVPRQTVNSALKRMENDGYIELLAGNDRRSKLVHLTERGAAVAAETVDRVIAAESGALEELTEEEQDILFPMLCKLTDSLRKKMSDI